MSVRRVMGTETEFGISVTGFDDTPMSEIVWPPLTTVHQSPERMGQEMVSLLVDAMAHPDEPPEPRILPTHLVVRDSS